MIWHPIAMVGAWNIGNGQENIHPNFIFVWKIERQFREILLFQTGTNVRPHCVCKAGFQIPCR
jgi:hypothetical protein